MTAPTQADIIDLAHRIAAEYTPFARWAMNRRVICALLGRKQFYPKRRTRSMKGK